MIFATPASFNESPADNLKRKMEENYYHPFKEISPGMPIYELDATTDRFWIGIGMLIADAAAFALMYYSNPIDQYVLFHGLAMSVSAALIAYYRKRRKIVLDGRSLQYSFYVGEELMHRGHYHNIYIRCKGLKSAGGDWFYSIVLGGYEIDEQALTLAVNQSKMERIRKLGRRVAARLHLNYFDSQDRSRHHIIRHRPEMMHHERRGAVFVNEKLV